jgi:phenylacetate-coenzyme A ligase PaaK-like adenylate-forming protein
LGLRLGDRRLGAGVDDVTPLWPHRLGILSISALDPYLPPSEVVRELRRQRPDVLRIRADLLLELVQRTPADELRALGLRLIFCGATLTTKSFRLQAQEAFGCPVIDLYGAHEINLVAFECPACGAYHTIDDSVILEILEDGRPVGPGEQGSVYVTALHSYTMPFIRYALGDVASRPSGPLNCRFGFSRLATIQGRQQQILEFPSGAVLHPNQIFRWLNTVSGVGRLQVVRDGPRHVIVHAELLPGQTLALDALRSRCAEVFPEEIFVEVDQGPIEHGPSLKHCLVRTEPRIEPKEGASSHASPL